MAEPRVSVVIPAYRCEQTIGGAIDSLLAQTRRPDEIIVVDDGSPDDIKSALRPYGDAVTLLRKQNGGASSARNAGIDASTGDLIAFLDADDFWYPRKLEEQLRVFSEHPEVGVIASRYVVDMGNGRSETYPLPHEAPWDQVVRPDGRKAFDLAMIVFTSVVIFRREVLGSDRFDVGLKTAEDRDLWVTLVTRAPVYFESTPNATKIELADSLSHSDVDADCRCMLQVIQRHHRLLGAAGVRDWEASVYRRWAGEYLGRGKGSRALRPAVKRLCYQPLSAEGWWVLAKSSFLTIGTAPVTAARQRRAG